MGADERATPRWPWLVAAAAVWFGGRGLPLPGVDVELLAEVSRGGGLLGLFNQTVTPVSLVGDTLSSLVLVQLALLIGGALERPLARRLGLAVYLAACAVQGYAIAVFLEDANAASPFGDVVPAPGMAFRITATLGITAGGALLWWVTGRLDRVRAARGFAFLALLGGVSGAIGDATTAAASVAQGAVAPIGALALFAMPVALVVVGVALLARPAPFPTKLFGPVALTSGWDALAIPAVVAIPFAAWSGGVAALAPVAASGPLTWVAATAVVASAVAFAAFWLRRPPDAAAGRAVGPAVASFVALFLCAGAALSAFGASGGAARLGPGPLAGEASFTLVLEADGRFAPTDGAAMVARLEALGARGTVEAADARRITLRVEDAIGIEEVEDALQPRVLEMSFTLERDDDPLRGALPTVPGGDYGSGRIRGWRGPCDEIEHMMDAPPPGCDIPAFEPPGEADFEPDCTLHCLEQDLILSTADVEDARVQSDEMTGQPVVMLELTSEGATRFGAATARHLRRALAIVVDGEVLSAPIVQSRIDGGRVQITLGAAGDPEATRREAAALAAALCPGARIATHFAVAEVR